jgi:hypothetical protein
MRILTGIGGGLVAGILVLVQFLGWCQWCPAGAFMTAHAPALILADLIAHGEAGWSVIPFTMVAQWLLIGAVVGLVLHLRYVSKRSA